VAEEPLAKTPDLYSKAVALDMQAARREALETMRQQGVSVLDRVAWSRCCVTMCPERRLPRHVNMVTQQRDHATLPRPAASDKRHRRFQSVLPRRADPLPPSRPAVSK